jgi:hypothetical protein
MLQVGPALARGRLASAESVLRVDTIVNESVALVTGPGQAVTFAVNFLNRNGGGMRVRTQRRLECLVVPSERMVFFLHCKAAIVAIDVGIAPSAI